MIKILAKPWVGEFGWELFMWQPYLRTIAKTNQLTVCVKRGKEALYEDFAHDVITCDFETSDENMYIGKVSNYDDTHYQKHPDQYTHQLIIDPSDPFSYLLVPPTFKKFGDVSIENKYNFLYHARTTTKLNTGDRNWSTEKWSELLENFKDHKIGAIGTKNDAEHLIGDDLRGIPLSELINILSSSTILVGPSSGPMHLGSLCGIAHIVWTQRVYAPAIKGTNKDRYETIWNPFDTPVDVIELDTWDPSVETVYNKIIKNENFTHSGIHPVLNKYMEG